MSDGPSRKDLVVLVADKNIEFAVRGLLGARAPALRIRRVTFDVLSHPEHDPGCLLNSHGLLRPQCRANAHALVLFDRKGCGRENCDCVTLEAEVEAHLASSGWGGGRAAAVVLDPEIEIWVWSGSPHVETVLGWTGLPGGLRSRLEEERLWAVGAPKPADPKVAMEWALRLSRKPRSSALYERLAEQVSLDSCIDQAFAKFRSTLQSWFGVDGAAALSPPK